MSYLSFCLFCLAFYLALGINYEKSEVHKDLANSEVYGNRETAENNATFTGGKCLLCTLIMRRSLVRIKKDGNITQLLELIKRVCIILRLESPKVCIGGIDIFGRHAAAILKKVELRAEDVCFLTFPDQCAISTISSSISRKWQVKLPERSTHAPSCRKYFAANSTKVFKALHISDIHVDMRYSPGSVADCGKPICCRAEQRTDTSSSKWSEIAYSVVSKFIPVHEPEKKAPGAGKWGDYRSCDLPPRTLENLLETVAKGNLDGDTAGALDYIIWTGDVASHDVWNQSESGVRESLEYLTTAIRKRFPHTRVFPVAGNHDSFPPNNFPPSQTKLDGDKLDRWIYDALAKAWSPWLPEDALETVKKGGYYTVVVYPGFRIVALNTNFCYAENWWIYLNPEDPGEMLKWFINVLSEAERCGERVHVIGHVPPGRSPDCLDTWSENYYRILERFSRTITAQFFGHTHFDEIQLYYANEEETLPYSVAYLAPSVTPYVDMNPAFRIYDVDSSWSVVDYRTFAMNLTDANQMSKPLWKLEYSARNAYNLPSLSVVNWGRMIAKWKNYFERKREVPPPEDLVKYLQFYSRGRFRNETIAGSGPVQGFSANTNLPCEDISCAWRVVCDIVKNSRMRFCSK